MSQVHPILATAVLLLELQQGRPLGTASGFFYARGDRVYLVTNRHVVRDEAKNHRPDSLRLRLHQDPSNLTRSVDFDVPLYVGGTPKWFVHPRYPNPPIDIAIVDVDQQALKKGHFFKALSKDNFLPDDLILAPGEDVMVVGFPRGLSDTTHNLPILRDAMIASAFEVPFQGRPMFIIDGILHPGTSGSPVITRPKNTWQTKSGDTSLMTGTPMYLLGVHSATLNTNLPSGVEPLSLAAVWYAALLEEILDSIPRGIP